jgi:hypothetical protein
LSVWTAVSFWDQWDGEGTVSGESLGQRLAWLAGLEVGPLAAGVKLEGERPLGLSGECQAGTRPATICDLVEGNSEPGKKERVGFNEH